MLPQARHFPPRSAKLQYDIRFALAATCSLYRSITLLAVPPAKRLALASNIACTFSITIKLASSCEPLPPDMIFIIRRPMTLPDSNARDTVEKKGPNIALLSEQRNAAVVKCLAR